MAKVIETNPPKKTTPSVVLELEPQEVETLHDLLRFISGGVHNPNEPMPKNKHGSRSRRFFAKQILLALREALDRDEYTSGCFAKDIIGSIKFEDTKS